jgi:multimeric flavodoxin WrbA
MNSILLNGTTGTSDLPAHPAVAPLLLARMRERGWQPVGHELAAMAIAPCRGCFHCWVRTQGRCIVRDDGDRVLADLAWADVVALLTPIRFGGYGYELKKAMDRAIPILLPFFAVRHGEIHHPHRYPVRRRLLAVGLLPQPDAQAEAVFRQVVARNSLNLNAVATSILVIDRPLAAADLDDRVATALGQLEAA